MRISYISIEFWRNFRNIEIHVPTDLGVVCLIGENGAGKSNLLELIAAAAHHLGVSPGIELSRGNPMQEPHSFELHLSLPFEANEILPAQILTKNEDWLVHSVASWDQTLRLHSYRGESNQDAGTHVRAGGVADPDASNRLGNQLANGLKQRPETHYLSLDADRSYPKIQINPTHFAEAQSTDWTLPQHHKQRAYRKTQDLYEEWLRYFLAIEAQYATHFATETRRAQRQDKDRPEFSDPFESYAIAINRALPHLRFDGVDTKQRSILFDSSGQGLPFSALSGGEREIAFVLGQIERFQLRQGLLMIDEPELHLNPDLVRRWIAYLRDTVESGQLWISTHSMEAAEVAGNDATYVLKRDPESRDVTQVSRVSKEPVLRILSSAVGSPAFSIEDRVFIFVEGERHRGERERFFRIVGESNELRFMEGGSCNSVLNKLDTIEALGSEAGYSLRIAGVVDRDFKTNSEVQTIERKSNVFVLPCHEVENFFLSIDPLRIVAQQSGIESDIETQVAAIFDDMAGQWVLERACYRVEDIPKPVDRSVRKFAGDCRWSAITADKRAFVRELAAKQEELKSHSGFRHSVQESVDEFDKLRNQGDLWKFIMGKEALGRLPPCLGLTSTDVLEAHVLGVWRSNPDTVPPGVEQLRRFIGSL